MTREATVIRILIPCRACDGLVEAYSLTVPRPLCQACIEKART